MLVNFVKRIEQCINDLEKLIHASQMYYKSHHIDKSPERFVCHEQNQKIRKQDEPECSCERTATHFKEESSKTICVLAKIQNQFSTEIMSTVDPYFQRS